MVILNKICTKKEEAVRLISECEETFDRHINEIAEDICADKELRCLTLAGPTCSGKTTTAAKLTAAIDKTGKRARVITIDDFYYDEKEMVSRNIQNFENADAIDKELFENTVNKLMAGKTVMMPTFDFIKRERAAVTEYIPTPDDIYVFEGIQAIYPEITSILKPLNYKSIFINVATGIKVENTVFERSEIRLIRRIVRDIGHRNTPPERTMQLWSSVRKNEEINIYPYVGHENYVINSMLAYEVLLLSDRFLKVTENYPSDGVFAKTVYSLRTRLETISHNAVTIDLVPMTSVIREFAD